MNSNHEKPQLVWDIPVRLFHWLLVLAIAAQWFTAEQRGDWLEWHFYIGYFTIGLILYRLIWGVVGTRYAKFTEFFPTPKSLLLWFKDNKQEYVGHPPLGALMVVLMLTIILIQGVSGLFTTDDIFTDGPWREVLSSQWQDYADWLHGNVFTVIQVAIAVHIIAALYYFLVKKNNLIWPLISGRKSVPEHQAIRSSKPVIAIVVLLFVAVIVYLIIAMAPTPVVDDFY